MIDLVNFLTPSPPQTQKCCNANFPIKACSNTAKDIILISKLELTAQKLCVSLIMFQISYPKLKFPTGYLIE